MSAERKTSADAVLGAMPLFYAGIQSEHAAQRAPSYVISVRCAQGQMRHRQDSTSCTMGWAKLWVETRNPIILCIARRAAATESVRV